MCLDEVPVLAGWARPYPQLGAALMEVSGLFLSHSPSPFTPPSDSTPTHYMTSVQEQLWQISSWLWISASCNPSLQETASQKQMCDWHWCKSHLSWPSSTLNNIHRSLNSSDGCNSVKSWKKPHENWFTTTQRTWCMLQWNPLFSAVSVHSLFSKVPYPGASTVTTDEQWNLCHNVSRMHWHFISSCCDTPKL